MSDSTSYPEAGFARRAGDFISAAKLIAEEGEQEGEGGQRFVHVLFPFLFLIGHGLELAYKAILLEADATEEELKRIGHNLVECRGEVQVRRPGLLEELEKPGTDQIVEMIAPYYKAKFLEYHKPGLYQELPSDPNRVVAITAGTVKNVENWLRQRVCQKIRDVSRAACIDTSPTR